MPIFQWKDDLSIGIDEIDEQHKELIKKLNNLAEAILQQKGTDQIVRAMRFMENYADTHFSTEEKYMERYNYIDLQHQKDDHERFKNVVKKLKRELESEGVSESFAALVQRYLIDWLILHIKNSDLKFGEFLRTTEE